MLILTQRPGQKTMIGDDIAVWPIWSENQHVRLEAQCPKGMKFRRMRNQICFSNGITVRILRAGRRQARIGFEAPVCIPIWREEIYNKIKQEQ